MNDQIFDEVLASWEEEFKIYMVEDAKWGKKTYTYIVYVY
jgi:hypothetical protein